MGKSIQLHPQWSQKHKDYMGRAYAATISVAEGAVRAGKTVDNVAVFARHLESGTPDRIHLATGSTAANAKLNIGDCNGFGLEYIFRGRCHWAKYKGNEALIIKIRKRTYIVIFAGAAKADSFKKIRGNSYGMWIATEINLHHEKTIQEAFNRQLAAKNRRIFWDLNPSSPASFIYKSYIDGFAEQYGNRYCYEHFTIRDNLTITPERLSDIEAQYDKKSIWYKRDILGQRCNAEGLIYDMFDPERHVSDTLPQLEGEWYVSSDFGIQNATTFRLWRKEAGNDVWWSVREYAYSGRDERRQKTVQELVDDCERMLNGIEPEDFIVDPSAAALIVELRKRGHSVRKANNDVLDGISDVASMLSLDRLKFHSSCKLAIEEFGLYSWDEKASEAGEDKPLKVNDHACDDIRYFVRTMRLVKDHDDSGIEDDLWMYM